MVLNQFINIIFIYILISPIYSERKLIFVYEHARHGARGPSSSYDAIFENGTDEYGIYWGTDGELTQIGKRQHYYLGLRNKLKYGNLINMSEYNPKQLLIHATNYNRTYQSIMSELYGMFEDIEERDLTTNEMNYSMVNNQYMNHSNPDLYKSINQNISSIGNKINKKSFPVFNVHPFPSNRIFLVDHCIKLNNYRYEQTGKKISEYYNQFDAEFGDNLTKFTGKELAFFHIYDKMKSVTDHFICDYDNKKNLSHVENAGINLTRFYEFSKDFYGHFIFDYFVDKYTSGLEETHLMQDVIGYMDKRIKANKDNIGDTYKAPKMVMDCGHDTTVGPMARFIDSVFDCGYHNFCEFACNIYFELYQEDGNDNYTIDYYLDDAKLFERRDYNEFKKNIEAHYWNDSYMDEFCGRKEDSDYDNESELEKHAVLLFNISIIASSLFLIFLTSTIVIFRRLKALQKKLKENPLMENEIEGSELPALT